MADPKEAAGAKRILIIEDDSALAQLLTGFFTKSGFETKAESKGKLGIEAFREMRPHLVLLDILLPDMNGFDVLKRMHEVPWAEQCAFILMSGIMKDQKTRTEAINKHHADAFIEKPFQVREMHNTILKCLGLDEIQEKAEPKPAKVTKAPVIPEPAVTIEGGEIGTLDLPRILCAFLTAKVSGVLKIMQGDVIKAVYFEDGKPIFAASNFPQDRIGELCVRTGQVSQEQLDAALKECGEQSRLGTVLVQKGVLSAPDLYSLIQMQVREIVLSLFAWTTGRYAFHFENLAGREMIKLQTPPADLVLEGVRRFYTMERLIKAVVSQERILEKAENPHFRYQQLHLGGNETKILDLINGKRSILQIITDSKQAGVEVMQLLYAFMAMKIVQDKAEKA